MPSSPIGYGITVGRYAVAMLMRRAGLAGLPGSRRPRRRGPQVPTTADLVDRQFARTEPDRLWVTDLERHEAFLNLAVVKGHRHAPVAAGVLKLRAA